MVGLAVRADALEPGPAELHELYPSTFKRLQRLFRSRGLSVEEASDLAQDVSARTIVHLRRHGQTRDDIGPLIMTIARNALIERVRTRRPALMPLGAAEDVADPHQDPAEVVVSRELHDVVHRAMRQLSPRQRRALSLSLDGAAPAEIAMHLGIERNAADALLHRARRRLGVVLSSMRDGLWSVIGVPVVQMRSWTRRAESWFSTPNAGAMLPSLSAAVAAVAVAGTLAAGGSSGQATSGPAPAVAALDVVIADVAASTPVDGGATAQPSDAADAAPAPVSVTSNVGDREVGAAANGTNPTTGEDETLAGVDIWHEREDDRGAVGPALDDASATACTPADDVCGEGGNDGA